MEAEITTNFIVFFVSSLWHGTYPGFYILFIATAFIDSANKTMSKLNFVISISEALPEQIKFLILWLWNFGFAGYFACGMYMLEFNYFTKLMHNFYYVHLIVLVIISIVP